jgi:hypothetical protein
MPVHQLKRIFMCSPGNPTGTLISLAYLRAIPDYEGIVVIDEACIDLSEPGRSSVALITEYDADAGQKLWARRNLVPHAFPFSMLSSHIPQRPTQTQHSSLTAATHLLPHKYQRRHTTSPHQGLISHLRALSPATALSVLCTIRLKWLVAFRTKLLSALHNL